MFGNYFGTIISVFLLSLHSGGCDQVVNQPDNIQREVRSKVILENQTNHSGVLLKFIDQNTHTASDDSGFFDPIMWHPEDPMPNGDYVVKVIYPYFESLDTTVTILNGNIDPALNIHLSQNTRFWVEPSDTSGVIDSDGTLRGYAINLTDQQQDYGTGSSQNRWAITPVARSWNPERCRSCEQISRGVQGVPSGIRLAPHETQIIGYFRFNHFAGCSVFYCIEPGGYNVFVGSVSSEYEDYFGHSIWSDSFKAGLNKSLLRKPELIQPAQIFVINN